MIQRLIFFFGMFFLFTPLSFASPRLFTFEQTFPVNAGDVLLEHMFVEEDPDIAQITITNGIRIIIPDEVPAIWNPENFILQSEGSANEKVNHNIVFENNAKTMYIPVEKPFTPDDVLIIKKAKMRIYGTVTSFYLYLDTNGDGVGEYKANDPIIIEESSLSDTSRPFKPQNIRSEYIYGGLRLYWNQSIDPDAVKMVIEKNKNGQYSDYIEKDADSQFYDDRAVSVGDELSYTLYFFDARNYGEKTTYNIVIENITNNNVNSSVGNTNTNSSVTNANDNTNLNTNSSCSCSCTVESCSSCCKFLYTFNDMPTTYWAHDFAEFMFAKGIFEGVWKSGVRLFEPARTINRAEMVKVAVEALDKRDTFYPSGQPYYDVLVNAWYAPYVSIAKQLSLVLSYGGYFYPAKLVTRAEALQTLFVIGDVAIDANLTTDKFKDVYASNPYMKYIAYAYNKGIIEGYSDGTFRPYNYINRAEIAKLLTLLLTL